jgi:hypothetical protein
LDNNLPQGHRAIIHVLSHSVCLPFTTFFFFSSFYFFNLTSFRQYYCYFSSYSVICVVLFRAVNLAISFSFFPSF